MGLAIQCTSCQKQYNVPEAQAGKLVKCKQCGTNMRVSAPQVAAAAPVAPPQPAKSAAKPVPPRKPATPATRPPPPPAPPTGFVPAPPAPAAPGMGQPWSGQPAPMADLSGGMLPPLGAPGLAAQGMPYSNMGAMPGTMPGSMPNYQAGWPQQPMSGAGMMNGPQLGGLEALSAYSNGMMAGAYPMGSPALGTAPGGGFLNSPAWDQTPAKKKKKKKKSAWKKVAGALMLNVGAGIRVVWGILLALGGIALMCFCLYAAVVPDSQGFVHISLRGFVGGIALIGWGGKCIWGSSDDDDGDF